MRLNTCGFLLISLVFSGAFAPRVEAQPDYWLFESDPVRPIALSPDKLRLFVTNTPDGYLEVYVRDTVADPFSVETAVPVGLEPVAVAARTNDEVWVVNHLSDSVSVINLSQSPPRVIRTLLVGDEPRDIVFAGPGGDRAFITTAHRGQNTDYPDGNFATAGEPRADVWVFDGSGACSVTTTTDCSVDADCPGGETCDRGFGSSLTGAQEHVVQLFGDRPRALAASPDGSRVYAAVYRSGNQTVPLSEGLVCDDGATNCNVMGTIYPAGRPEPRVGYCDGDISVPCIDNSCSGTCSGGTCNNVPAGRTCNNDGDCQFGSCERRETGVIVGKNGATGNWEDEMGNNWNNAVKFDLPDYDVFEIDANAATPTELGSVSGVGTILFNMLVAPNGDVYVTNTDANNRVRFEGEGDYVNIIGPKPSGDPASVLGNLAKSRITVLDASGDIGGTTETEFAVLPRHLNKHIDYSDHDPAPSVRLASVATPLAMALSDDGSTLYMAAFGSKAVAIYDTAALKNDTFDPVTTVTQIPIGQRPTGLFLDDANNRLYVATREFFYVFDTTDNGLVQSRGFFSPEDNSIRDGRKFLYDARLTSANGEASCSSCHIFGDMDDLAWDLGNPDAAAFDNPNFVPPAVAGNNNVNNLEPFDSLKGPMTTQSLRGMKHAGPMHWRGDRTGAASGGDAEDSKAAFVAFNEAFPGLLGRVFDEDPNDSIPAGQLLSTDIEAFADFALQLTYPPNPIRALDNTLDSEQAAGEVLYTAPATDIVSDCNGCHELDRTKGFFGTGGGSTFEGEEMEFKVPHLRNLYQKVGMFGMAQSPFFPNASGTDMGDQVRGTGYLHDGSVSRVRDFLSAAAFTSGNPVNPLTTTPGGGVDQLTAFMMAFDTDLAPIVGQQATLSDSSGTDIDDRITLLIQRAEASFTLPPADLGGSAIAAHECDLVVKGVIGGEQRGWLYDRTTDLFDPDTVGEPSLDRVQLEALVVPGEPLTFTCVPPGAGTRMGLNRDGDSKLDGDDSYPGVFNIETPGRDCSNRVAPGNDTNATSSLLFLVLAGVFGRFAAAGRRRRRS
ncbi:MAG: hypothetical protein ACN4G0_01200 [Polyangiales bacterium]